MSHAGSHLDRQRQLQADADLARRLHTQLNSPGGSAASPKPPAPAAAAAAAASRAAVNKHRCTECSLEFAPGEQYVSINNGATHFHTRCFVCTGCRRPLQGSYVTEPGSSARYHSECQNARVRDTCFACRSAIRFADTATQALGHIYHAKCFVCAGCSKPFDHASFVQHEHQPYHAQCHRQLFHPRCDACNAPLPEQPVSAGSSRIVWSTVAFWSERYCPSHFQGAKRLRACTGCARLEPTSAAWPQLPDGRTLCLACLDTSIPDTPAANSLYVNVMAFMRRLGCALPSQPPLSLVDESALNAHHQGAHSHDAPESAPSFHTRGMCLTEYSQQYLEQSVVDARGRKVSVSVDKVGARQCNVNAILVLSGLPRLLTGALRDVHHILNSPDHFFSLFFFFFYFLHSQV
jgi:hypothetical protein